MRANGMVDTTMAIGSGKNVRLAEPESPDASNRSVGKSLLSGAILLSSAALGAFIPGVLPFDLQQSYQASAVYLVKPLPPSTDGIAEAARARLAQQETLNAIAKQLDWNRLGETGEQSQTSLGFLRELMTGREMTLGRSEAAQRERLERMLLVSAAGYPGGILVSASSTNAQFAADAANAAAMQLASLEGGASSSGIGSQIDIARKALEQAQIALDNAGVTDEAVRAERQIEVERDALAADVERLQGQIDDLTKQVETLLKMKFSDVLSQPLPEELAQTGLESLRQRYLSAQMNVDQLSAELGPRHPRFLAAKAAVDEARAAVAKALSGIVTDLNRQKARTAKELDDVKPKLEMLQKRTVPEPITRRLELEKNVENARKIYLDRLREANISQASTVRAELTTTATATNASAIGMPHWIYMMFGALAGLCIGGACLPARRLSHSVGSADSPEIYPLIEDVETANHDVSLVVEPQPERAPTFMQPPVPLQLTEQTLRELDEVALDLGQPKPRHEPVRLPHFEDYYDSNFDQMQDRASDGHEYGERRAKVEELEAVAANDDRSLAWLTELVVANKMSEASGEPLPYLLASILKDRSFASEIPEATDEATEAELQQLLAELEILRRELAQHEAAERQNRFAMAI
ncbi:hypothetical protein MUU53_00755 [Rhizobium lemnae]|uniref:Succinoglycan biosynthesis transport protein n=1 Tax=Rhizobium lemnae TaxID=1214924 RepID=A0ABV8EBY5_9HYPH|nr:hypothetical protein [Rhizobium lemnae]MCJ8506435.1 hypothetical protein [Rhizobium lemnae]